MADLFGVVAVLFVEADVLERLTLQTSQLIWAVGGVIDARTSMGLNGFAIRPMVDE